MNTCRVGLLKWDTVIQLVWRFTRLFRPDADDGRASANTIGWTGSQSDVVEGVGAEVVENEGVTRGDGPVLLLRARTRGVVVQLVTGDLDIVSHRPGQLDLGGRDGLTGKVFRLSGNC